MRTDPSAMQTASNTNISWQLDGDPTLRDRGRKERGGRIRTNPDKCGPQLRMKDVGGSFRARGVTSSADSVTPLIETAPMTWVSADFNHPDLARAGRNLAEIAPRSLPAR